MSKPATTNKPVEPKRDRHGFRGVPPPATFSITALPDDAHLKDLEAAAVLRVSTNTLAAWRGVPGHPLKWTTIPGGFVRYEAGELKRFRASGGERRKPSGRPKGSKDKSKSAPRRARRAKADDPTTAQEAAP